MLRSKNSRSLDASESGPRDQNYSPDLGKQVRAFSLWGGLRRIAARWSRSRVLSAQTLDWNDVHILSVEITGESPPPQQDGHKCR